jgi:glycogen debranching enzyme
MPSKAVIELENKFYIAADSSYTDTQIKVVNHVDTFGIFDRWGDIRQWGHEAPGIYHEGTRFISGLEFRINEERPLFLSSAIKEEDESLTVDLTNDAFTFKIKEEERKVQKGSIHIERNKFVKNGSCHERITLFNYGNSLAEIKCSLYFNADFKDIFEIRGIERTKHGDIFEVKHVSPRELSIKYKGLDSIVRQTKIMLLDAPEIWETQYMAQYTVSLEPHTNYVIEYSIFFNISDTAPQEEIGFDEAHSRLNQERKIVRESIPDISTSNTQFNKWIERSRSDMLSLLAQTQSGLYPYAGVPWYNTPFGRDGIITALQVLCIAPNVAHDVLIFLAETQATALDAASDAEPGKIFHEFRRGEMVELGEIPFKRYYGSIDSTPLFIMLAGAYYERTGDLDLIAKIWANIEAALNWMKQYGDTDGDGFIEYKQKSVNGLFNQAWKDSLDSMMHEDGELAVPPIAPCEVQGYVYDAKLKAAILASALDKKEMAEKLRAEAIDLKRKFNEVFWNEELGMYVIALDGKKKQCVVKSSNAGQTLFTGIVDAFKTTRLVKELMSDDLFSGWGIRTLAMGEARYNPMSYHNGSVWPHDNSLIAFGFAKHGYKKEAEKLMQSMFDASLFIELQRLPELFCGFPRRAGEGPTAYPVACSPQAWSVGAVFKMLEACLHIEIDALNKRVIFRKPTLPDFLDNLTITNIKLGDNIACFELHRYKSDTVINITQQPDDWEIHWIK